MKKHVETSKTAEFAVVDTGSDSPADANTVDTTRRNFGAAMASTLGFSLGGGGAFLLSTGNTLALETEQWVVNGANLETDHGEITGISFGDADDVDDDALVVHYSGLNQPGRDMTLEIRVRGVDDGDPVGWTGGESTRWEPLASNTLTLEDRSGTLNLSWEDAFGSDKPVDVTEHSEITIEDFEVLEGDTERVRTLAVELFVSVPAEDIERSQVNEADITVWVDGKPRIDQFDVTDNSNPTWDRAVVDWAVSHPSGDLDEVVSELRREGESEVLDSAETNVDGWEADGQHDLQSDSEGPYEIDLSVIDTDGTVVTETKPFGAPDDFDDGETEFVTLTAEVTDSRGPQNTPTEVTFAYELDTTEAHEIQFIVEVNDDIAIETVEGPEGTVVVSRKGGQLLDEPIATVTADIDGGQSCSRDISVDLDQVELCV